MADKIVYLVSKITSWMLDTSLSWVDDETLSALMSEGYEQVSTMVRKVAGVKATMIVLRPSGENRGMVRAQPEATHEMSAPQSFTGGHQRELALALQNMGESGHLGGIRNHSMPGLSIVSGELVGKAYDAGQIAANRGMSTDACPFPPGSAPYTKWMQGYRSASGGPQEVTESAGKQAYSDGMNMARSLGRDDPVHCPYPRGSPLRDQWLRGFKAGGGRVV